MVSCFSVVVPSSAFSRADGSERRGPIRRSVNENILGVTSLHGCMTLYETFRRSVKLHPSRPCFGERSIDSSGVAGPFVFRSYSQCATAVRSLASGFTKENIVQMNEDGLKLLGIYMKNCSAWCIAEYACYSIGGATVPLYDTLGPDAVEFVINQTKLSACVCSSAELPILCKVASRCPSLHFLLLNTGVASVAEIQMSRAVGLKLFTLNEIDTIGRAYPAPPNPPNADDLATFCYTSGTTGDPKGALITHKNIVSVATAALNSCFDIRYDDYYLSFLPLPHIFERMVISALVSCGSAVGFYRGDPLQLIEDCVALRPSIFCAVPRLLNKLHDKIETGMLAGAGLKSKMFRFALDTKLHNLRTSGDLDSLLWDTVIFRKIKIALGLDKVRRLVSGGAPLSVGTMNFFRILLGHGSSVHEGYGLTETTGGISLTSHDDLSCAGHVGGPLPVAEVCLSDVPDMGYFHTDVTHGDIRCDGRGEILVRGPNVFSGYYKNLQATSEVLTPDGWLRTGDIGLWQPNGQLAIIDRKKNLLKLSQGEYVAVEKVENILCRASLVNQIFVHGDSTKDFVVGIIVPDQESRKSWLMFNEDNDSAFEQAVFKEILEQGTAHGLKGFEMVKRIHIDTTVGEWSPQNGLTTPTQKIKRVELRTKYKSEIENMYALGKGSSGSPYISKL